VYALGRLRVVSTYPARSLETTDLPATILVFLLAVAAYGTFISVFGEAPARMAIGGMWFQSDGWRVFDDMTDLNANHFRDNVHPLFSITFIPLTNAIKSLSGLRFIEIILLLNCIFYASLCSLVYYTSRLIGCLPLDSFLLSGVVGTSAGSIYWFSVPETYPVASLSVIVPITVIAAASKRDWLLAFASAASLAFTVSNWVIGLWAALMSKSLCRAAFVSAAGLLIVLCGWGVSKIVFPYPGSLFLLPSSVMSESAYILHDDGGSVLDKLGGELLSSIVAPQAKYLYNQPTGTMLSVQSQIDDTLRTGDVPFLAAIVALFGLYALSIYAYRSRIDAVTLTIGCGLLSQIAINLVYGEETMLYSLHFVPLIALLFAIALSSDLRVYARPLIAVLITAAMLNNIREMRAITELPFTGTSEFLYRLTL
jgi:hypothetical protein